MDEIHRFLCHYNAPITDQKNSSIGAVSESSEPPKHISLVLGRQLEILAIYFAEISYAETPKRRQRIKIGYQARLSLVNSNTMISTAALSHGIE